MMDVFLPTAPAPSSVERTLIYNGQLHRGLFGSGISSTARPGGIWTIKINYDPGTRNDLSDVIAAFESLRGYRNRLLVPFFEAQTPRGNVSGNPRVAGSGQTGSNLATTGWTPNTLVMRAGDFFSLGSGGEIKKIVTDCTSDAAGNATLDFVPDLRMVPANDTSIVTADLSMRFMAQESVFGAPVDVNGWYSVSWSGFEDIKGHT